jgi:hypothetical protein
MGTDIDLLLANYTSAVGASASKNSKALMGKSNQVVSQQLGATEHEGSQMKPRAVSSHVNSKNNKKAQVAGAPVKAVV